MRNIFSFLQSWVSARAEDETGATMVEYGLMVALIAIAALGAVTLLGIEVRDLFLRVGVAL